MLLSQLLFRGIRMRLIEPCKQLSTMFPYKSLYSQSTIWRRPRSAGMPIYDVALRGTPLEMSPEQGRGFYPLTGLRDHRFHPRSWVPYY